MSLHPRISTIIATHNRPQLLRDALDSLATQTLRPAEVIVVDDGSGPATRAAVDDWRHRHGDRLHVRYLHQRNQGPAVARNHGLAEARGTLVQFMDDDDVMEPDALQRLAEALASRDDAAIAMASHALVGPDARKKVGPVIRPDADGPLAAMIAGSWFVPIHGYLFNRAALAATGSWDAGYSSQEDDEFLLRAALADVAFMPAPAARVYYRQHDGVRRATPGKPGETVEQGRRKRMLDDLFIREHVAARLRADGRLDAQRDAFERWLDRFRNRYGDLLPELKISSPLLTWLGFAAQGRGARQAAGIASPAVRAGSGRGAALAAKTP